MASGDGGIMLDSIEMDSLSTKNTDFKTNSLTKTSESEDDGKFFFVYGLFYDRLICPNCLEFIGQMFFFFKKKKRS